MLSFSKIYFCCMSMCVPVYVLGCVWCVYVSLSVCVCVCPPHACLVPAESLDKSDISFGDRGSCELPDVEAEN